MPANLPSKSYSSTYSYSFGQSSRTLPNPSLVAEFSNRASPEWKLSERCYAFPVQSSFGSPSHAPPRISFIVFHLPVNVPSGCFRSHPSPDLVQLARRFHFVSIIIETQYNNLLSLQTQTLHPSCLEPLSLLTPLARSVRGISIQK